MSVYSRGYIGIYSLNICSSNDVALFLGQYELMSALNCNVPIVKFDPVLLLFFWMSV